HRQDEGEHQIDEQSAEGFDDRGALAEDEPDDGADDDSAEDEQRESVVAQDSDGLRRRLVPVRGFRCIRNVWGGHRACLSRSAWCQRSITASAAKLWVSAHCRYYGKRTWPKSTQGGGSPACPATLPGDGIHWAGRLELSSRHPTCSGSVHFSGTQDRHPAVDCHEDPQKESTGQESADEVGGPMPAEGERHHHGIHADRGDTPPQKQHGSARNAAVSGDEIGDSTVDEHGRGGGAGRLADSAGPEVEQPALKESRVVQSGRGPSEQNLE